MDKDKELYAEAANAPDVGGVWWLIKSGVSVNAHDNGWSALAGAIAYNPDPSMVEELCSQKADVNHACPCNGINSWPKWDPLRLAARHGRLEHAKILLKYGASVAPAEYNAAHIPIAIDHGHAAVAALLMRQGARITPFLLYIDKEKKVFDEARRIYYEEDVCLIAQKLNAEDFPTYHIAAPVNAITASYAAEYPLMKTHPLETVTLPSKVPVPAAFTATR
jgi:ankyrin repeat protein